MSGCTAAQLAKIGVLKQKAVVEGQLFCAKAMGTTGTVTVALATALGVPITVIGVAADVVKEACAKIDAMPVSPPADPAAAPVVAVPAIAVPLPVTQTSVDNSQSGTTRLPGPGGVASGSKG